MSARALVATSLALLACSGGESEPSAAGPPPACAEPEVGVADGSCIRPGVAPEGCGVGFVHDGAYGCEPQLPAESCPDGFMALPGETVCRAVSPCAEGKWGDIPVEANTVYVDGSYTGADSDGSAAKPYATITAGVTAAPAGALIAVTDGTYLEDVLVQGKTVRLWGVCPHGVELVGTGTKRAALDIRTGANGTEAHRLALRGGATGLSLSGSVDVLVDEVWVHDNLARGINIQGTLGPTSLHVTRTLIEKNREIGVYAGSDIRFEDTVVRGSLPVAGGQAGLGMQISSCDAGDGCFSYVLTTATVVHSVFEENLRISLFIAGAHASVESTLVRSTDPQASDQIDGSGIAIGLECTSDSCDSGHPPLATVVGSVIEQSHATGVVVTGGEATIENVVVRNTRSSLADGQSGEGIRVSLSCLQGSCDPASRPLATVRNALVEQNQGAGVVVGGAQASIENLVVRDSLPRSIDQRYGTGMMVSPACGAAGCAPSRAAVILKGSLLERNMTHGIFVAGSDITVERSVVRGTLPQASNSAGGRGIHLQILCFGDFCDPTVTSGATLRNLVVDQNRDAGIFVGDSDAFIEQVVVRNTAARVDGLFGDGVAMVGTKAPTNATITDARIESSARAGVSNFGAFVSLGSTRVRCASMMLSGDHYASRDFVYEDRGGNACGCPEPDGPCKAVSAGLQAPDPPSAP